MKAKLTPKSRKDWIMLVATFVSCVVAMLMIACILHVMFEPGVMGGITPSAILNVKKQAIGEEVRWNVTVECVTEPADVKYIGYKIIDEEGHIKDSGRLLEKNNVTFIDKDKSSTLNEGDFLYIRGAPYSDVRSGDELRLLFKGKGMASVEL